ncbi:TFIID-18kDa-domain-containing protein [Testicularia cyperi]|uniref:TFIID-18kDa-domain-containing protein n=1 Tax=Testicularia cyperi TaxID=1882483 RepID=A0A317XX88_9BASI|nr:TFIID-18kDa-domain-containing protein [Testicularia cyperi]
MQALSLGEGEVQSAPPASWERHVPSQSSTGARNTHVTFMTRPYMFSMFDSGPPQHTELPSTLACIVRQCFGGLFAGTDGIDGDGAMPEYRYQVEIAQMMFVFADVVDPAPDVTRLVEDIVRTQVIEMIIQSRRLAQRRASKYLSPEDLIFLIRYDRAKVNRLRTYLSWKDVRKNAKDSGDSAGAPSTEMDALEDPTAIDGPSMKATKMKIRLPWEISSVYSEHLISLPGADGEEEEDEDDLEAHEDSMQRLKDADEATRQMTRDEYVHYSECRQASFTFRKAKKFREFINSNAYLDVKPNDDIIDILGFLAFEVVRELCVGAVAIKKSLEEKESVRTATRVQDQNSTSAASSTKRKATDTADESSDPAKRARSDTLDGNLANTTTTTTAANANTDPAPTTDPNSQLGTDTKQHPSNESDNDLCTLFTLPPTVETPLRPSHIHEAFAKLQRGRAALTTGIRGSGGPGGLRRTRVFVI